MRQSSSSESWSRALHERLQSLSGATIVARQPQVSEFFLASWEKPSADALVILLHSKLLGEMCSFQSLGQMVIVGPNDL